MAPITGHGWADLPPDLLGDVQSRLPSYLEHVRVRAVCRSWRSSARMPALLPWAALRNGAFLDLAEGALERIPIPEDDVVYRVSTGRMLFLVRRDGGCSLMDPHSGDATPQHIEPDLLYVGLLSSDPLVLHRRPVDTKRPVSRQTSRHVGDNIGKVVVSDHFVAVLTRFYDPDGNVSIHTRGGSGSGTMRMAWAPPDEFSRRTVDMALFQGKLYILTTQLLPRNCGLHALDMATGESVQCIRNSTPPTRVSPGYDRSRRVCSYLVSSGDRLLMVEHTIDCKTGDQTYAPSQFEVYEADLSDDGHGRWNRVDTLMGRALFVSEGCSKSLPAGGTGAREDCIYFMNERPRTAIRPKDATMMELESGVYNMRERTTIAPLPPLETATTSSVDGAWSPTWLFPPKPFEF